MKKVRLAAATAAAILLLSSISAPAQAQNFPERIPLPNGFQPEGIASGRGTDFYAGSLADGAIYKGDVRTGQGAILVPGTTGRVSVGMKFDSRSGYLFVAGGPTGLANVFDTSNGTLAASFQLTGTGSFINDVVVTRQAAYFTDSTSATLYKLPLGPAGSLPDSQAVSAIPLSGDWTQVTGFNANGIDALPNGKTLFVINSTEGALYRVDPNSGQATRIVAGPALTAGDGILLDGKTIYVVRNQLNQIAVVRLDPHYDSGQVVDTISSPLFRVPTTVAEFGKRLYAVNARFGTPTGPDVDYDVVQVTKSKSKSK